MDRRHFIKAGSLSAVASILKIGMLPQLSTAATGNDYKALVCIFLVGGNDANNMVVPMDDASYAAYKRGRKQLALQKSDLTQIVTTQNNAPYAFHSALQDLTPLFSAGKLAVIANVGPLARPVTRDQYLQRILPIPTNLFSHSDQIVAWQTSSGQVSDASIGWGGRVADQVALSQYNVSSFPPFVSMSGSTIQGLGARTIPLSVIPNYPFSHWAFSQAGLGRGAPEAFGTVLEQQQASTLMNSANGIVSVGLANMSTLNEARAKGRSLVTKFPSTTLGAALKQVAELIQLRDVLKVSRQLFFCSLGGFDTHENQLNDQRFLLSAMGGAMLSFYRAMEELGVVNQVVTFTESEFGRTFDPTRTGSDHGWGGHHLVMGGSVRGGRIFGRFPQFELGGPDDADNRGRWIPSISVDQYAGTLCSWFGFSNDQVISVLPNLPNFSLQNLGFV